MKLNKVDHICIAVKNLDEARKAWEPLLGKDKPDDEYVDEPGEDQGGPLYGRRGRLRTHGINTAPMAMWPSSLRNEAKE